MYKRQDWNKHQVGFHGIAHRIERQYRRYRQRGEANSGMEEWLDKVMVERTCPDCKGARLRATRLLFTIGGKSIYEAGNLNFDEMCIRDRQNSPISQECAKILWMGKWRLKTKFRQYSI